MHGVALLLAAAALGYAASRLLRAPSIPLLLLAGLALSFVRPPEAAVLEDALLLGVSFLLFVVGLELDPRRTRAQRTAAIRVGLVQFFVLAVLGFAAARGLGFDPVAAGYLALAVTASSTLVGVRLLQRRRQMFEPFGRLVLGVLLLQDVLVLAMIPLVTELGGSWRAALAGLGGVLLLGAMSLLCRRWVGPLLLLVAEDQESVLLGTLTLLFLFLAAAGLLGVPLVVGAFLAGVALSRFPVNGIVRPEVAPIGDFFAAIFFTALGALVGVPTGAQLVQAAVLALVVVLVTPPLVTVIAERAGFSARPAIEAGLLLSQTSEISLVIGLSGMIQGSIGQDVFTVIALVTLATMLLTPILAADAVALRLMHLYPLRRQPPEPPPYDHVLLLGTGATGMPLLEDLILAGSYVVVVDDDPAVIARLAEAEVRTIRGDASDTEVLRQAGVERARVVSSTIRRPRDNATLLELARGVPTLVRVFDDADADWVRERGGIPVLYSEAAADGLMEWFEEERERLEARTAASA
ncbi:MAG TPA: cation:proton antiporter [Longimicrobiales bacterium]|nr:cation:proton antiporter [Longimicrobiales bacterium]